MYFLSLFVIHVLYALVFLGVFSAVPRYVYMWNIGVQIFLCLFLMFRYHPFRQHYKMKPLDARLVFGAACLLMVNVISLPVLYSAASYLKNAL